MPEYLAGIAEVRKTYPGVLQKIQPLATRSTVGCPNNCAFCGVDKIEPRSVELPQWPDRPVYCDNNILASSRKHFDRVIERLKKHNFADFNQGLDTRLLTKYHADRFSELNNPTLRLAWDTPSQESAFMYAFQLLRNAGIAKKYIRCYVMIGFRDTPENAYYRLTTVKSLGIKLMPMRYNPLDTLKRNTYVDEAAGWTNDLLKDYMKYFFNDQHFRGLPFEKFDRLLRKKPDTLTPSLFPEE